MRIERIRKEITHWENINPCLRIQRFYSRHCIVIAIVINSKHKIVFNHGQIKFTSNLNQNLKFHAKDKRTFGIKWKSGSRTASFFISAAENIIFELLNSSRPYERDGREQPSAHSHSHSHARPTDPYQCDSSNTTILLHYDCMAHLSVTGSIRQYKWQIDSSVFGKCVSIEFAHSKLICPFSKMKMSVMTIRCEWWMYHFDLCVTEHKHWILSHAQWDFRSLLIRCDSEI